MDDRVRENRDAINQFLGQRRLLMWVIPALMGLVGSSVAAVVVAEILKG